MLWNSEQDTPPCRPPQHSAPRRTRVPRGNFKCASMLAAREHGATRTAIAHLEHHFAWDLFVWNAAALDVQSQCRNPPRCVECVKPFQDRLLIHGLR